MRHFSPAFPTADYKRNHRESAEKGKSVLLVGQRDANEKVQNADDRAVDHQPRLGDRVSDTLEVFGGGFRVHRAIGL